MSFHLAVAAGGLLTWDLAFFRGVVSTTANAAELLFAEVTSVADALAAEALEDIILLGSRALSGYNTVLQSLDR